MYLLHRCGGLILFFSVIISLTRLIGHTQPNPISLLLTSADASACEMPCVLGVKPGQMTTEQAIKILQAHPLLKSLKQMYPSNNDVTFYSKQLYVAILTDQFDRQKVNGISIGWTVGNADATDMPDASQALQHALADVVLGNVMSQFGTVDVMTTAAYIDPNSHVLKETFAECFYRARVCATTDTLEPGARSSLTIVAPDVNLEGYLIGNRCPSWLGFRRFRDFEALQYCTVGVP